MNQLGYVVKPFVVSCCVANQKIYIQQKHDSFVYFIQIIYTSLEFQIISNIIFYCNHKQFFLVEIITLFFIAKSTCAIQHM